LAAFLQTLILSLLRANLVDRVTDRTERLGEAILMFAVALVLATLTLTVLLATLWIWLSRHMAPDYAGLIIAGILFVAALVVGLWARHLLRPPKRPAHQSGNLAIPDWAIELFQLIKPHLGEAVIASLIAGWAAGRKHHD